MIQESGDSCLRIVAGLGRVLAMKHPGREVAAHIDRGKLPG
jgi:hypothetical protein